MAEIDNASSGGALTRTELENLQYEVLQECDALESSAPSPLAPVDDQLEFLRKVFELQGRAGFLGELLMRLNTQLD